MEMSSQFPVKHLCDVLDINRSGFYKWKKRLEKPSDKLKTLVSNLILFKEYHSKYPSHGYRWLNAKFVWIQDLWYQISMLISYVKQRA